MTVSLIDETATAEPSPTSSRRNHVGPLSTLHLSAFRIPPSAFCILHSPLTLHSSAFRIPHSALRIPHSPFPVRILHSAFCILNSALAGSLFTVHYSGWPTR